MKQNYKFKGGIYIGWLYANSWPNGTLEIDQNSLILRDELIKKEYKFSKDEVTRFEIHRIPLIGSTLRIHHTNKNYTRRLVFGCWNSRFKELINTLKEFGWMV